MIQHFGNNANSTIAQYEVKEYPLLLVITKSQAGLEICSVLKGKSPQPKPKFGNINYFALS